MDEEDDVYRLSLKPVKFLIFMGDHTDFHTWWFHFQVFAMVWKFTEAIDRTPKPYFPSTASTTLSMNEATQRKQMLAKSQMQLHFPI